MIPVDSMTLVLSHARIYVYGEATCVWTGCSVHKKRRELAKQKKSWLHPRYAALHYLGNKRIHFVMHLTPEAAVVGRVVNCKESMFEATSSLPGASTHFSFYGTHVKNMP